MMDMRGGKLVSDCPRCGTYNDVTEVPAWYNNRNKVKQIENQVFDMWEAICSNCGLYYQTGTDHLRGMRRPTEKEWMDGLARVRERKEQEKKPDLKYSFTPTNWSLGYEHDEDGYVVSITNKKFRSLQLDSKAYEIVNGMIVSIIDFLKLYAKLGDPVDEGAEK